MQIGWTAFAQAVVVFLIGCCVLLIFFRRTRIWVSLGPGAFGFKLKMGSAPASPPGGFVFLSWPSVVKEVPAALGRGITCLGGKILLEALCTSIILSQFVMKVIKKTGKACEKTGDVLRDSTDPVRAKASEAYGWMGTKFLNLHARLALLRSYLEGCVPILFNPWIWFSLFQGVITGFMEADEAWRKGKSLLFTIERDICRVVVRYVCTRVSPQNRGRVLRGSKTFFTCLGYFCSKRPRPESKDKQVEKAAKKWDRFVRHFAKNVNAVAGSMKDWLDGAMSMNVVSMKPSETEAIFLDPEDTADAVGRYFGFLVYMTMFQAVTGEGLAKPGKQPRMKARSCVNVDTVVADAKQSAPGKPDQGLARERYELPSGFQAVRLPSGKIQVEHVDPSRANERVPKLIEDMAKLLGDVESKGLTNEGKSSTVDTTPSVYLSDMPPLEVDPDLVEPSPVVSEAKVDTSARSLADEKLQQEFKAELELLRKTVELLKTAPNLQEVKCEGMMNSQAITQPQASVLAPPPKKTKKKKVTFANSSASSSSEERVGAVPSVKPEARPSKPTSHEFGMEFKGKLPKKRKAPVKKTRRFVPNPNRRVMTNKEKNRVSGGLYTDLVNILKSIEEGYGRECETLGSWADQNPPPTWLADTLRKILNENHPNFNPDRDETKEDRDLSLQINLYNDQFLDKLVNELWVKALGKPFKPNHEPGAFKDLMLKHMPDRWTKWVTKKAVFDADLRDRMTKNPTVKPEGLNLNNLPIVTELRDNGIQVNFKDGTSITGRGVMVEFKKNGEQRRGLVVSRHVLWPDKRSDGKPIPKDIRSVKIFPPVDQPLELYPLQKATDPANPAKMKKAFQLDYFGDDIDLLMLRSPSISHLPVEDISEEPVAGKLLYTEYDRDAVSHPFYCAQEPKIINSGDYSTKGPGSSGAGIRVVDTQGNVKVVGFHQGCIREGREGMNSWISVRVLENCQPLQASSG